MNTLKEILLSKRVKSFAWRLGAVMTIAGVAYLQQNITNFELPGWTVLVGGLILGEITKALNNYYQGL
jgi:hypothetical protein